MITKEELKTALATVAEGLRDAIKNGLPEDASITIEHGRVTLNGARCGEVRFGCQETADHLDSFQESPLSAYWLVSHGPDLNETGSCQKRTYIKTIWKGFPAQRNCEDLIVSEFCRERFGPSVAYVQGVAATTAWYVAISNREAFQKAEPIKWGGYATETRRVVLEIGDHGKTVLVSDEVA